ncbi:hypothetical protein SK803_20500 [Lentzea sp. BCCO 10_0856]|uniref:Uncharacterized protein n=1 Tax=Lentzea miocenica TaxID=3095431 RepID=A0ABU4T358_9PSEU|nr:hypothetical protein [Lentzea sp. BCCO 10_0856]MDX8032602.1 hypothetical protein [Lentzea sp. BCCO 10_0856]
MIPALWTMAYGERGNALTRGVARLAVRTTEFLRALSRCGHDTFTIL